MTPARRPRPPVSGGADRYDADVASPALPLTATRWPAPAIAGAVLTALAVASIFLFAVLSIINGNGDSLAVISGTHKAIQCMADGTWTGCGGEVAPYPLLQYLPTFVFIKLGLGDQSILRAFGVISAIAFAGTVGLTWFTLQRLGRPALAVAATLVMLVSPLPWYAWSTFGESLGALACLGFVAAAALRAPAPVLALTLIAAGQTKETALPFVLLLGIGAILWSPVVDRPRRRAHWIGLVVGAVVSLLLTAGFNEFRFDQMTNLIYADPIAHTTGLSLKIKFAGSIWVAPNAGVIPFWPLSAIVFLATTLIGLFHLRRPSPDRIRIVGAALVLVLCLAGLTAGYASWYAPFGWIAWGPRLMLLMIPASVLFCAVTLSAELQALLAARGRAAAALLGLVAIVALVAWTPQVGELHNNGTLGALFAPDSTCPVQAPIGQNPGYYYTCIFHWAWWKHWMLPEAAKGLTATGWAKVISLVWLATVCSLLVAARRLATGSREHPAGTAALSDDATHAAADASASPAA